MLVSCSASTRELSRSLRSAVLTQIFRGFPPLSRWTPAYKPKVPVPSHSEVYDLSSFSIPFTERKKKETNNKIDVFLSPTWLFSYFTILDHLLNLWIDELNIEISELHIALRIWSLYWRHFYSYYTDIIYLYVIYLTTFPVAQDYNYSVGWQDD